MRVPGGGACCLGVGRPGTGALPAPTSRPFGRAAGAHYPLAVGAGGAGVGTRHLRQSARSCVLWGRHEGARGARLLPGCGASGVGRSPTLDDSSFRACGRGPLPTACGCGGCGRGDPSPTPQRALLRAAFARCGGGTRAPGGGASCLGVGRPGTGALPPPTSLPLGRAAGAHYPLAVRAGAAGLGTRHQPHSARSCVLWGRHEGARGARLLRRQTITCQKFHPNTGYFFHLMYAYITQGRPDRGLLRLTPRAQAIITQGIGVYAAPRLQPTQITARTAQGNPIYVYHPTAIARLPIPSDTDIVYFTDASGTQQRTPTVGCASVRISRHADGLHVEHHTGATIFGASSHGELRTMADAVTATPPPTTIRPRIIWVVVDATVDIHLTRRLADLPLHKALESGLTTQALGLWMAFRGMHPQDALHIVKQESHRYAYGNEHADTQAKHQNTSHTPGLEHVRLDTPHHSHLQHLPPIPPATQPPELMPEDTPYTDRDKQYHYPTSIQQLATTLGHPANTEPLRRLEDSVHTPLYYSALRPDPLPAHLQKPRLELALEQLPLLTRYHRWYARRSIHVPARYTKCICSHTEEETWDHFKVCPLYRGLDTLTDWNPTHTIAQHAGWLTQSPATQQLTTVLKQTEVLEAVRRGLVPTAIYSLLRTHAEDPQATAAHMQRTAVAKTAEQLTYRTHKYLQHAATLPQTDQAHLLKLLFYQP